ncbi:MAG: response regulator transcription factor [Paludibacter sp.]|nr:response regulator transcription factor [Paludibacter sp.]
MNPPFTKKPDIIIVDDHLIFRQGLKAIINFEEVGTVIGEASNGEELMQFLSAMKPDLVLMDIDMPQMDGFEATKKALELFPDLKIIAFTVFSEEAYSYKMIELGAKGFLLKSGGINELENAIELVMQGELYFSTQPELKVNADLDKDQKGVSGNEIDKAKSTRKMLFYPWMTNKENRVKI